VLCARVRVLRWPRLTDNSSCWPTGTRYRADLAVLASLALSAKSAAPVISGSAWKVMPNPLSGRDHQEHGRARVYRVIPESASCMEASSAAIRGTVS